MSQSDEHRSLVLQVAKALSERFDAISLTTDVQKAPGDIIPPQIGGFRPDVYGTLKNRQYTVIAEAKTNRDIENKHTQNQIEAFVNHIEYATGGCVVLAARGYGADSAKTLMRFMHMEINALNVDFAVYDGDLFWWLDKIEGKQWHLD